MKIYIYCFLLSISICLSINTTAQDHNPIFSQTYTSENLSDSIGQIHALEEFVVEGRSQLVGSNGISFIPSKKEVQHSHNAGNLIQNMSIPFLNSDGVTIRSMFSTELKVFIDFLEASEYDLQSLQPKDVISIEYLEYPSDARFKGAKYVVNFIMRHINYGGYVKGDISRSFIVNSGDYSLYSKYESGNCMLDLSASGMNSKNKIYNNTHEVFSGFDNIDPDCFPLINRDEKSATHNKNNNYTFHGRLKYNFNKSVLSNTAGISFDHKPKSKTSSEIQYSPEVFNGNSSSSESYFKNISPYWTGEFTYFLNQNMSLNIEGHFGFSRQDSRSEYLFAESTPILNKSKWTTFQEYLISTYSYTINARNRFNATLVAQWFQYKTEYSGTNVRNPIQNNSNQFYNIGATYTHSFLNNMRLSLNLKGICTIKDIGGISFSDFYPSATLHLYYPINSRNSLSFSGSYNQGASGLRSYTDALTQSNEILWIQGNKNIKLCKMTNFNVGYTFSPSNTVSFAASSYFSKNIDTATEIWTPVDAYKVIKSWNYNGQLTSFFTDIAMTLKLFNNNLRLKPDLTYSLNRYSKIQNQTYKGFSCSIQGTYYLNDFSFRASYRSKTQSMVKSTGGYAKIPSFYLIGIDYDKNNLSISLTGYNLFLKDRFTKSVVNTLYYQSLTSFADNNFSQQVSLSVVYTFEFGKQVNKWDTIR